MRSEVSALQADIHATVLPIIGDAVDPPVQAFLRAGGRSVLLGESREEYVAREMSAERRGRESGSSVRALTDEARELAGASVLVAVDQELGGIQRLHSLVPALPNLPAARVQPDGELVAAARATARGMRDLGVTMNLAPVLDVMDAPNPWLDGRHLGGDPPEVTRLGAAFVAGMRAGGVACAAKHFPGNRGVREDPALARASIPPYPGDREDDLGPFRAAIVAGAEAVMLGPAVAESIDAEAPASLSAPVVRLLREELGFGGVVITDDLDAVSILRDDDLIDAGVRALNAGADLLLVAGGPGLEHFCDGLAAAVGDGRVERTRVRDAAGRVRALAEAAWPSAQTGALSSDSHR